MQGPAFEWSLHLIGLSQKFKSQFLAKEFSLLTDLAPVLCILPSNLVLKTFIKGVKKGIWS